MDKQEFVKALIEVKKRVVSSTEHEQGSGWLYICPKFIPVVGGHRSDEFEEFFSNFKPSASQYEEFYNHPKFVKDVGLAWWDGDVKAQRVLFLSALIKDIKAGEWDGIFNELETLVP